MPTIEIDSLTIDYIDQGEGDTILLLHGWNAPASTYRLIIDHLSTRFRVIAPNAPGCGDSDEPPEPWTVDRFADFTTAFAKALGLSKVTLMGHSFGGRTIIKLMSRQPRPFKVDKIVLLDAAGIKPKRSLGYYAKVYSFKALKAVCSVPPFKQLFPNAVENARKKRGSADYRQASDVMRRTMSLCINEDLTPFLKLVDVPTLLIWGECDTATPLRDGQIMEKHIPDAGLVVLKGAGHFAFAEAWGQCSRVLDVFLK